MKSVHMTHVVVTYEEYMGNKLRFISMEQKTQLVFMKYGL